MMYRGKVLQEKVENSENLKICKQQHQEKGYVSGNSSYVLMKHEINQKESRHYLKDKLQLKEDV